MVDVAVGAVELLEGFFDPPTFDPGAWLRSRRGVMDTNECAWLEVLGDFCAEGAYAYDGHLSAASWLMWATGMARSTAYEKLRMAAALARRPIVKEAFAKGEISYSAARAICALDRPLPATDAALVNLARVAPVVDVEAAVRYYLLLASQDIPPYEPERREVSTRKGHHGLGQFRAVLGNDEVALIEVVIKAYMAARANPASGPAPEESARLDRHPKAPEGGADEGEADERGDTFDAVAHVDDWRALYGASRADAVMEIFSVAMANLGGAGLAGADRYMVHVVADAAGLRGEPGATAELVDGSVLPEASLARMACDASFVAHLLSEGSEPLALGRRVRGWTPAQRRAVRVRDRGRCRFPGCVRALGEIHHVKEWSEGGLTDLSNAASLCGRHHVLVHQGFRAEGDANAELVFHRPDGTVLGTSRPSRRPATLSRWGQSAA